MATQQKQNELLHSDRHLRGHLKRLGLDTIEQYRTWCADNGFSDKLRKKERQRVLEIEYAARLAARRQLLRQKRDARRRGDHLLSLARREIDARHVSTPSLIRFANAVKETNHKRKTLVELLTHLLSQRASFLNGYSFYPHDGEIAGNSAIEALPLLAAFGPHWVRPLESWKPKTRSARRQFISLLHHLLLRYGDMPAFLDRVWFTGHGGQSDKERLWYVQIGAGENFTRCNLPLPYTKRMAHHFLSAPNDATINEAIRWGQVIGLGGDDRLAQAIMGTRLANDFSQHPFWTTVIQWFIRNPLEDMAQVGPVIDYIYFQKFEVAYYYLGADQNEAGPARQPNFTMKGRTPEALLRQVNRWHAGLDSTFAFDVPQWKPSGLPSFDWLDKSWDGHDQWWSIREVCTAKELVAEGRKMHHCVASYASTCVRGARSIWRMEVESCGMHVKVLTLEVDPQTRTIVQARGKFNRLATDQEKDVLRRWASSVGLKLGNYV
ncbi:PcfJ domain-containing protein [Blastopirellula marina]|uniref:PcfJ-like protein n=1 Tax=Blastopirellula marina DSM 3645 TaxID=314230 RepID=A4A083_9BACT|nr:PcfJ domain-containing protein [Blastopirellula marina]EAQ77869.1 hypothetical protein DSM3645_06194 [Blastopirellula marina DSM 3645]